MKILLRSGSVIPILWFFFCPLIVGVARGAGVLVLRPNEFLFLILTIGLSVVLWLKAVNGRLVLPAFVKTDLAIMGLVVFGSLMPLLMGIARGTNLDADDYLYAFVFVKYAILYGMFRLLILNEQQRKIALLAIFASEAIVAIVALLQAKELFGVNELLAVYYDAPFEGSIGPDSLRASSTIASSFGLADSMTITLGLAIASLATNTFAATWQKTILGLSAVLFAIALLAAGSFTGVIGCVVAIFFVGVLTGRIKQLLVFAWPAIVIGSVLLWPTIAARLAGFSGASKLPQSWIGRLENLQRFFWPEIFSGWNWLLGVRPAARLVAPETWRNWVYIESGYTWLFWTGGLPLALAFSCFLCCVFWNLITDRRALAEESNPIAITAFASSAMMAVVMLFDPHLTVRGCADLYFPLLAMALASPRQETRLSSNAAGLRATNCGVNFKFMTRRTLKYASHISR